MCRSLRTFLPLLSLVAFGCASPTRFAELPDLPGGEDISYAYDIDGRGRSIVGESFSSISSIHGEGVVWKQTGGMWSAQGFGLPAAPPNPLNSPGSGIDRDGSTCSGRVSFGEPTAPGIDTLAYACKPGSGLALLPLVPGDVEAQASSTTEGGVRLVGFGSPEVGYHHPFPTFWQKTGPAWAVSRIETAIEGWAFRIDASGRFAIGWARSPDSIKVFGADTAHEAVCWTRVGTNWSRAWLGALPGHPPYSQANGFSKRNARWVVGFSGDPSAQPRPVRWRLHNGQPVDLIDLGLLKGSSGGGANGVSDDGKRVVGGCFGDAGSDAFLWVEGEGMKSIREMLVAAGVSDIEKWKLTAATGISEDGHVVCGYGTRLVGGVERERAWVATLP